MLADTVGPLSISARLGRARACQDYEEDAGAWLADLQAAVEQAEAEPMQQQPVQKGRPGPLGPGRVAEIPKDENVRGPSAPQVCQQERKYADPRVALTSPRARLRFPLHCLGSLYFEQSRKRTGSVVLAPPSKLACRSSA